MAPGSPGPTDPGPGGRWVVHSERALYRSEWVGLGLADVELPSGRRIAHHVVRVPRPAVGVVVHDPARGVLMLHRHRFIADRWVWEIPAGRVEEGESPAAAGAREVLEETGWRVGPLRSLFEFWPSIGLSDQRFHLLHAREASCAGPPSDLDESGAVAWVPLARVPELLRSGRVAGALGLTGLLWLLSSGGEPAP